MSLHQDNTYKAGYCPSPFVYPKSFSPAPIHILPSRQSATYPVKQGCAFGQGILIHFQGSEKCLQYSETDMFRYLKTFWVISERVLWTC